MIQAVSLHGKRWTNYCRAWQTIFKWFEAASAEKKLKWLDETRDVSGK